MFPIIIVSFLIGLALFYAFARGSNERRKESRKRYQKKQEELRQLLRARKDDAHHTGE